MRGARVRGCERCEGARVRGCEGRCEGLPRRSREAAEAGAKVRRDLQFLVASRAEVRPLSRGELEVSSLPVNAANKDEL